MPNLCSKQQKQRVKEEEERKEDEIFLFLKQQACTSVLEVLFNKLFNSREELEKQMMMSTPGPAVFFSFF